MLFNSFNFALFLPIVFILYWFVANKSLKDQVSRLESALDEQRVDSIMSRDRQEKKLDEMYKILIEHIAKVDKK